MKLKISPDLSLPIATVTGTQVVYGRKRKGKTYKAKVIAEEMLEHRQQIVVIDPTDAWWGLRSSANGAAAGYPITIFGGRHADLPLEATAGEELADAIADDDFSAIFSLKGMSRANEQRFCYSFLERLYRKNPQKPLHIFMDEADIYAPQSPFGEEARTLGATQNMVRRGGLDGLGMTLITQRPAVLSKSVSSQCDTLISVGLNDPRDLDSVKDWVNANFEDRELSKRLMADIPQLGRPENQGIAWVLSPDRDICARVTFRELKTFDSGRTPKVGEKRRTPRVLSKVDLEKLGKTIADSAARAKENDPKELKVRVANLHAENRLLEMKLERAIAKPAKAEPGVREKIVTREVTLKVTDAKQVARIEKLLKQGDALVTKLDDRAANAFDALDDIRQKFATNVDALRLELTDVHAGITDAMSANAESFAAAAASVKAGQPSTAVKQKGPSQLVGSGHGTDAGRQIRVTDVSPVGVPLNADLPDEGAVLPAHIKVLSAVHVMTGILHAHPDRMQVALVAKLSPSSGNFNNYLGRLRKFGLIDYPTPGRVALTIRGVEHVDHGADIPATTADLQRFVQALVKEARWKVLLQVIAVYPDPIDRNTVAERVGMSASSGNFNNYLGRLRKLGLVEYPSAGTVRATPVLFIDTPSPSSPPSSHTNGARTAPRSAVHHAIHGQGVPFSSRSPQRA